MDHPALRRYTADGREVLKGTNCKLLILAMFDRANRYGPFETVSGCELGPRRSRSSPQEAVEHRIRRERSFTRTVSFEEAVRTAKEKATRMIATVIQEALDENLGSEDAKEWNWQGVSLAVNNRYGLKTTDRQLKQIGPDQLLEFLTNEADKSLEQVDLSEGKEFLSPDWSVKSLADWARLKYGLSVTAEEFKGLTQAKARELLGKKSARCFTLRRPASR
jgi:hypothetical protein